MKIIVGWIMAIYFMQAANTGKFNSISNFLYVLSAICALSAFISLILLGGV